MKVVDIYSGTNIQSFAKMKADGVQGIFIKATQGVSYKNPKVDAFYKGAKAVGMLVGMYCFADKVGTPLQQYQNYMSVASKYKLDFKLCLDYELDNPNFTFIKTFMSYNPTMIFYSSHSIADHSGIAKNKIWIAEPDTVPTSLKGYAGIQYQWHGKVDGLIGDADLDFFGPEVMAVKQVVTTAKPVIATAKPVTPDTYPRQGTVTATELFVRQIPGPTGTKLGRKLQGDVVTIVKKTGDWYSILYGDHGGYVSAQYVK